MVKRLLRAVVVASALGGGAVVLGEVVQTVVIAEPASDIALMRWLRMPVGCWWYFANCQQGEAPKA